MDNLQITTKVSPPNHHHWQHSYQFIRTTVQLLQVCLRNNRLKFKTSGKVPTVSRGSLEHTSNRNIATWRLVGIGNTRILTDYIQQKLHSWFSPGSSHSLVSINVAKLALVVVLKGGGAWLWWLNVGGFGEFCVQGWHGTIILNSFISFYLKMEKKLKMNFYITFCGILSVPQNIIMNLNNVKCCISITVIIIYHEPWHVKMDFNIEVHIWKINIIGFHRVFGWFSHQEIKGYSLTLKMANSTLVSFIWIC